MTTKTKLRIAALFALCILGGCCCGPGAPKQVTLTRTVTYSPIITNLEAKTITHAPLSTNSVITITAGSTVQLTPGNGLDPTSTPSNVLCAVSVDPNNVYYVDVQPTAAKQMTVDTLLSGVSDTVLRVRLPNLTTVCNDDITPGVNLKSRVVIAKTVANSLYRITAAAKTGATGSGIQVTVTLSP